MNHQTALNRLQLLALTGSRAYKIHNPNSDSDYKGFTIALPKYYFGFSVFEQIDKGWENINIPGFEYLGKDTVVFEIRKFFKLLIENNPNIIDMLYSPEYKIITPVAQRILEVRDDFISKKCKFSFSGYAFSQYHKIQSHRKWLLNPPTHEPTLEEFGLSNDYKLDKTQLNAFIEFLYFLIQRRIEFAEEAELLEKYLIEVLKSEVDFKASLLAGIPKNCLKYAQEFSGASDNFTLLLHKQQQYNSAKKAWDNYQNWKKNRNPERASLEAKSGLDTKHAAHLIRLMRMGCEILEGKGVLVDRELAGDAEEIRSIRNGNIKYEDLLVEFEKLNQKIEELYKTSTLQHSPKKEKLEKLCEEIIEGYLKNGI
jgi:predicted nucleotidyltransferase